MNIQNQQAVNYQQRQGRNNNPDDCDQCCDDCCNCNLCENGDCCCQDCCKDCECNECGCDCFSAIQTQCLDNFQCCPCLACCTAGDILTELQFNKHIDEEEENQQLTHQFKQIIVDYRLTKSFTHPILKECYILKKKKKSTVQFEKLILNSFWFGNYKEYNTVLQKWLQAANQTNMILGIYGIRIPDICIDRWRLCILLPKFQSIDKLKQLSIPHYLSQCVRHLLKYHESSGVDDTAFFEQNNVYFLDNYFYMFPPILIDISLLKKYQQNKLIFHPPEWENENPQQFYDWDKCDCFLLALSALCLLNKCDQSLCYLDDTFNNSAAKRILEKCQHLLNQRVFDLLSAMLRVDPNARCTLSQVANELSYCEIPPMIQTKRISNFTQLSTQRKVQAMRQGHIKEMNDDGSGYDGEWIDDMMHGKGSLFGKNGQLIYKGGFYKNKFHDFGHLNNVFAEYGPIDYQDLSNLKNQWIKYEGDFSHDKKHGSGILYLCNGDKWAGQFRDDIPYGYGTYFQGNQEINGRWVQGIFQGQMI